MKYSGCSLLGWYSVEFEPVGRDPERAQIVIEGAEVLYCEIRIET